MVFQVYAGDLGQNTNSEQQMFNQLSRQRVAEGEGRGEETGKGGSLATDDWKDRREIENGPYMQKVRDDGWIDGKMDGDMTFHEVYPFSVNLKLHSLDN